MTKKEIFKLIKILPKSEAKYFKDLFLKLDKIKDNLFDFIDNNFSNSKLNLINDLGNGLDKFERDIHSYSMKLLDKIKARINELAGKERCRKCGGGGWLWGYELDEPPEVEDDTRYTCDGCDGEGYIE